MKIYKLKNKVEGFKSIDFGDLDVNSIAKGVSNIDLLSGKNFTWKDCDDTFDKSDCPFFIGAFPIFELSKIDKIGILVEFVCFKVDNFDYVAFKTVPFLENVLNIEKSDMRLFKSGKIMNINTYVFKNENYPSVFRIKEYPLFTFVNETFAQVLKGSGLNQLEFEECEVI